MIQEHATDGAVQFITDDQIARRLHQVANGLAHLEAAIPALRRELETLAGLLEPAGLLESADAD